MSKVRQIEDFPSELRMDVDLTSVKAQEGVRMNKQKKTETDWPGESRKKGMAPSDSETERKRKMRKANVEKNSQRVDELRNSKRKKWRN